jgi:hypothetical protein
MLLGDFYDVMGFSYGNYGVYNQQEGVSIPAIIEDTVGNNGFQTTT